MIGRTNLDAIITSADNDIVRLFNAHFFFPGEDVTLILWEGSRAKGRKLRFDKTMTFAAITNILVSSGFELRLADHRGFAIFEIPNGEVLSQRPEEAPMKLIAVSSS